MSPTEVHTPTSPASRKLMGTMTLALMVVAMASPVGVVVGTVPLMLGLGNGVGTPGAFTVIGVVLVVFAFGFAAMARALPSAGGFFGFIRAGLGARAGVAAGFVAACAYAIILVYVAALLAYYLNSFFRTRFGIDVDWSVWGVAVVVLVSVLMSFGVKESALVTAGLLMIEFAVLGTLVVAVFIRQGPGAFPLDSFAPSEVFSGSPGFALALAFLSFIGFEVTAVFTNHVRRPEKTIGRATMVGIVILTVVFSLGAWATIAGLGPAAAIAISQGTDAGQLIPTVAGVTVGPLLGVLFNVFMMTSLLATLIAVFNTTAQYTQKLARDLAPAGRLARSNPKSGSPVNTGLVLGILACVVVVLCRLAGLDPYVQIAALLGVLGAVAIFGLEIACAAAIFVYFRRARDRRIWTTALSPVIACVALTAFLVLVLGNYASLTGLSSPVIAWSPLLYVLVAVVGWSFGKEHTTSDEQGPARSEEPAEAKETFDVE